MISSVPILVLGSNGQVGRSLLETPPPAGMVLLGHGRQDTDLTRPGQIERALDQTGCALVVNAAAYTAVDQAESSPETAFRVNAQGAGDLARACARRGLPLIHLSTDYVFDGGRAEAYRPQDPTNPINQYGGSKLAGEEAVAASGPKNVILRTSWLFSQYGSNFVKTMLRLADERERLRVVDDQWGCPTGARGLAQAILTMAAAILDGKADGFGVFHYCGAQPATWYQLAQAVFEAKEEGPELVPISSRELARAARRPARSVLDCSHTTSVYGIVGQDWRRELDAVVRALS
jgi:dTDP-4-dehydrorhamnose reductase